MAASVNKAILVGNLGRDPELRRTKNGTPVTSFPIATTERFKDRNGEQQERTEWHNIVAWSKTAEIAEKYLSKGRQVYIEGKITTNSWEDNEGNKRYRTEIVARELQFLGGKGDSSFDSGSSSEPSNSAPPQEPASGGGGGEDIDDDLPF